ncbi:MAG: tRNA preQ1(34) S-adenosylmethionine ribosyltransferase-isomerase QueA [Thermoplasmata archaeon]
MGEGYKRDCFGHVTMKIAEFDFALPKELIAQEPAKPRDNARLLVIWKNNSRIEHRRFYEIVDYFESGDVIVMNDTKVVPVKIDAVKETGGRVRIILLKKIDEEHWEALASGKLNGKEFTVYAGDYALRIYKEGKRWVCTSPLLDEIIKKHGRIPLPPYIKKELEREEDYQTVYAKTNGSVAAPTAGLHFTEKLLENLRGKGVRLLFLTLHVGYGTFHIPECENVEEHCMEEEWFSIPEETASAINYAVKNRNRVCCVGTTTMRALESASKDGVVYPCEGLAKIFIYPNYKFQSPVNAFITNFHLPKSTPLFLTSAIVGKERLLEIYRIAIEQRYRFFSFGDAMLVL